MTRRLLLLACGVALLGAAPASADEAVPDVRTPDGPATLSSVWHGASTMEGRGPEVLTAVRIVVGPGGNAGPIRLRVSSSLDRSRGTQLGPWSELPAEPGTYVFPAPALHWDNRSAVIAVDQQVGGHAIVSTSPCTPEQGPGADLCQIVGLSVFHGLADGDPATGTPVAPDAQVPGQRLAVVGVTLADRDGDRVPDVDDRTDLRVTATRAFTAAGVAVLRATVENAGSRAVDRPVVVTDVASPGVAAWQPTCDSQSAPPYSGVFSLGWMMPDGIPSKSACRLEPIAAGASRTVVAQLPATVDGASVTVRTTGDGDDLAPGDNTVLAAPPPVLELRTGKGQRLVGGIRVGVRVHRAGRLRVIVRAGGVRTARTVSVRAQSHRTVVVRPQTGRRNARIATVAATLTTRSGAVSRASRRVRLAINR